MIKDIIRWSPLCIFVIILVFLLRGLSINPHKVSSPLVGRLAPASQAHLFQGKVSVLNVFATWCLSCKLELPLLMQLHRELPNLAIFGLSYKDQAKKVSTWLKEKGNPYHIVIDDPKGKIGMNWGVYGTPEMFVIDRNGIIRDKIVGQITPAILKEKLLPLIKRL